MSQPYICCFGEMLWDMFPSGKLPGGAPMNVATHLQNLGIKAYMISSVGNDDLGNELIQFLTSKKCSTQFVQTHSSLQTGTVSVTLSKNRDATYEIVAPVAWDEISFSDELEKLVENAEMLVFGSLVCRNEDSFETLKKLTKVAKTKVFDINLRQPFISREIIETFLPTTDILKLNDDELLILKEWYGNEQTSVADFLIELAQKFSLQRIILTLGSDGAMLYDNGNLYQVNGKSVKVADTIGCGDSFLAGFLKNLLECQSPTFALNYACSLGALVATYHGANPPIVEAQILNFMNN